MEWVRKECVALMKPLVEELCGDGGIGRWGNGSIRISGLPLR